MVVCVLFNFQRISRGGRSCTAGRYRHSSPTVVIIIHFVCLSVCLRIVEGGVAVRQGGTEIVVLQLFL